MRVLGLMSGTSADGIDTALVRISRKATKISARLEGFHAVAYSPQVRAAILRVANGASTTSAEISQLNFLLGELFARAALDACRRFRISPQRIALIGSHGQTIYHRGEASRFLGSSRVASTLQIGEPAIIAERTGITTVADFRPADMAAGGQGAPLVPFVDYLLYCDPRHGRLALNIGGIANVTVIPADARPRDIWAFDTGPGNMVIDGLARHFTRGRQSCDRDGRMALRGQTLHRLLGKLLKHPYFRMTPPKTAGREQFGERYVQRLIAWGRGRRARPEDLIRTATLLTPLSIADAFRRFILPKARIHELVVSGGGARNPLLMAQLSALLPGIETTTSSRFGIPEDAKEAFAFAILAYQAYQGRPNNLPSATGARHPAILGKVIHASAR